MNTNSKIFIVLFCLVSFSTDAAEVQSTSAYQPILENTVWLSSLHGMEGYMSSLHTIAGDTIINGTPYKIIYQEYVHLAGIWNDPSIWGYDSLYFREDTLTRQLFQFYQGMGERLVFDFSLQIGDSLPGINNHDFILTTIDSVSVIQGYRRIFNFTKIGFQPIIWIEGIGNPAIPFNNEAIYDTAYAQLICLHKNGNLVYEYQNFVQVNCGLYNSIQPVAANIKEISVYPNPSSGLVSIELKSEAIANGLSVVIFNTLGEVVLTRDIQQQRKLELDLRNHPMGVYFIRVVGSAHSETERIIIL